MHFVHVPTPGDHYSPATGSAVMTVIHGMTVPHIAAGGFAAVLVSRGTTDGYPPYAAGETREIDLPVALPGAAQKAFDAAMGRICSRRPCHAALYRAVPAALGSQFDGTLLIHNAPAAIPFLRKKLPHAAIALYAHNRLFNTYSPREVRHIINHADAICCVSNFIARDIAARAGEDSSKLKVVLNGVDTAAFAPNRSPSLSHSPSQIPTILFLGRIQPTKGPDLLLKAAAQLPQSLPFKLRIVGSTNFNANDALTPYEQGLRHLAAPLKDKVEFHPFVPREKVAAEYQSADIFVAPSNWDEPFGLTIAEALACGTASILSNRGGIPEVAADAAIYFSPPDITELAEQLRKLLGDQALREAFAAKARARGEFLAWPRRYESLLESLGLPLNHSAV
jgi:glycosyltransferase involved in cell wall biosynthesis